MKDERREPVRIVDPGEEQPPDWIVSGHGRCGVVEHALCLGARGFGLSP
jgi:hypothetical protein